MWILGDFSGFESSYARNIIGGALVGTHGLRLCILFEPNIVFRLRASSIANHKRLDPDQKRIIRGSKGISIQNR